MRETVPSMSSDTHTPPAPTATPLGELPSGIRATVRRRAGSSRAMPCPKETQTAPGVTATGRGSSGPPRSIRYVRATVRKAGSITRASPRSSSATQTPLGPAPSPSRSMPGDPCL